MNDLSNQPLNRLNVFSLKGVQMKTFHITWLTFFFCFFAWFGIAPLMPLVSESLHLTKGQKANAAIAAVSAGWAFAKAGSTLPVSDSSCVIRPNFTE